MEETADAVTVTMGITHTTMATDTTKTMNVQNCRTETDLSQSLILNLSPKRRRKSTSVRRLRSQLRNAESQRGSAESQRESAESQRESAESQSQDITMIITTEMLGD